MPMYYVLSVDDKKISRDCVLKLKIVNGGDGKTVCLKFPLLFRE